MKKPVSVKLLLLAVALTVTGVLSANAFPVAEYALSVPTVSISHWHLYQLLGNLQAGNDDNFLVMGLAGLGLMCVVASRRWKNL